MKSFGQFLTEATIIRGDSKGHKYNEHVKSKKPMSPEDHGFNHIGETPHHTIHQAVHKTSNGPNGKYSEYIAHNKKTGHVDMHVDGYARKHTNGHTTLHVSTLSGRSDSKLKAHDFYHHLITKHNHILVGSEHTEGGAHVWRKLASKKDVNVHGMHHDKPVNLDPHDSEETHVSDDELHHHEKGVGMGPRTTHSDDHAHEIKHTVLVAHKK